MLIGGVMQLGAVHKIRGDAHRPRRERIEELGNLFGGKAMHQPMLGAIQDIFVLRQKRRGR